MAVSMAPLRDEHRGLRPEIDALRTTGDEVGAVDAETLRASVAARLTFLRDHLRPHAMAEDEALYPVVARLLGGPDATASMRRDHVEVLRLTDELGQLHDRITDTAVDQQLAQELRRVLYGLYAVVSLHFAKEEEVYVPALEAGLSPAEADAMFHEMHVAHHRAAGGHAAHAD